MELKGHRNVYVCEECKGFIVTENQIDLVTPFMIGCKSSRTCNGMMKSRMYPTYVQGHCPGSTLIPTDWLWVPYTEEEVEWYRKNDAEMHEWATTSHGKLIPNSDSALSFEFGARLEEVACDTVAELPEPQRGRMMEVLDAINDHRSGAELESRLK